MSYPVCHCRHSAERHVAFVGRKLGGMVAGKRRWVRSDWMAVERKRGISVSSAVVSFEHQGLAFNLLDTPGHQDFSPLGFQPTGISAGTPTAP
jgi:peptide subunit release factor RF-3